MKILLTPDQVQQLRPYFDRVRAAAALGSPGMLVGQISYLNGEYTITPGFLDHEKAAILTEQGRTLEEVDVMRAKQ